MTHTSRRLRTGFTAALLALLLLPGAASANADEGSAASGHEEHSSHTGGHDEAPTSDVPDSAPGSGGLGDQDAASDLSDEHPASHGIQGTEHGGAEAQQDTEEQPADHETHGADPAVGGHDAHGDTSETAPDRPRAAVLGTFAAVNGGVLITAFVMRRRTRHELTRRKAARAAALKQN